VTVEAVAARSGIAKTTIYRRYRDRRDMLSAALSRVTTPEPLAVHADAPDRLRWLIKEAVKTVEVGIGYGGLAALLTDEDPAFTKLFRRILAKQRAELGSVIDAGKAVGRSAPMSTPRRSSTPWSARTSPSAPARGESLPVGSPIVRPLLADRARLSSASARRDSANCGASVCPPPQCGPSA